jgi:hypothetical protein
MDPVKVVGVADWLELTSKKEVQSFLGFTNFYQHFIKDFSKHAQPLFDLTKNDGPPFSSPPTLPSPSTSKQTAPTSQLEPSSPKSPLKMGDGTWSPSSLNPFPQLSVTMKYMTKRCSLSSDPYKNGNIS